MSNVKKYTGKNLDYIGFPLGGIGAGMFFVEGTGCLSAFSLRHEPDIYFEPPIFSALTVKGFGDRKSVSRVLESQVPTYKIFGGYGTRIRADQRGPHVGKGNGNSGKTYGLPRFREGVFASRFPFADIKLTDPAVPLEVSLAAWSPFTPPNADDSSYPFAFLDYTFENKQDETIEAVYYFVSSNIMDVGKQTGQVKKHNKGFILSQPASEDAPWDKGFFHAFVEDPNTKVNAAMFRGGWFDPLTMTWNDIEAGISEDKEHTTSCELPTPGASLSVAFKLEPGESKTIRLNCCWYVPHSNLDCPDPFGGAAVYNNCCDACTIDLDQCYSPWYTSKFDSIESLATFQSEQVDRLYNESILFRDTFYASTLPDVIMEAVGANLSILKSPTVMRQKDGRLWCWEGCCDEHGCCPGSCTHVWNYAFAICYLFPELERGMRQTEFVDSQSCSGHQQFRATLPITQQSEGFYAAADGQLGGIIKVYRDYVIHGDKAWLESLWPQVKNSMDYCINEWDKKREGVLVEPHHNTYDIEFWGPNGMCSSFYVAALAAMVEMGNDLGDDCLEYADLLAKGKVYLNEKLYNGEYYIQDVQWENLTAKLPEIGQKEAINGVMSPEGHELIHKYGPKYQYGNGCISDGVLGSWMANMSGLGNVLDDEKVKSHLLSIFKYNFREDISTHANPQRPGFCVGYEAGLLLCSWPHGDKPALPFVYSDEVWTGIEYQVASHLIAMGCKEEGLKIVEACRSRYDGSNRNPFDEYECGHFYARALASYSLLNAYTGMKYDARNKTLTLRAGQDDVQVFLCTDTGYGLAGIRNGDPFVEVIKGDIPVENFILG